MASERGWFARWKFRRLCKKHGICQIHGTLMRMEGCYEPRWLCDTCLAENEAKNTHREKVDHLKRVAIQEQIIKGLQLKREIEIKNGA